MESIRHFHGKLSQCGLSILFSGGLHSGIELRSLDEWKPAIGHGLSLSSISRLMCYGHVRGYHWEKVTEVYAGCLCNLLGLLNYYKIIRIIVLSQ